MSLLKTFKAVSSYAQNPYESLLKTWNELTHIDGRITTLEDATPPSEPTFTVVTVAIAKSATSGASASNSAIKSGKIIGWYPVNCVDAVSAVALNSTTGAVTVTLAAAATPTGGDSVDVIVQT